MNRRASLPRPRVPRIKVQFDLTDEAERRAHDWIQAFHSTNGIYKLLDVRRGFSAEGTKMAWTLTRSQAARAHARPQWLVIAYAIEELSISLPSYRTLRVARAAFEEATTGATPSALARPAPHTPA